MQPGDLSIGTLFERVREAIIVVEPDTGSIVLWNPAATSIFGYSSRDALGLPIERLVPGLPSGHSGTEGSPEDRPATPPGRPLAMLELPAVRKDGEILWVEASLSPLHDPRGRPFTLVIARDVTDRKRAESELRSIAASARCLLWQATVQELDGDLEWSLGVLDEEAAQRFLPLDVPAGESYAEAWYNSKPDEDRERMAVIGNGALRAGKARYSQEFRCRQRDGEERWFWEDVHIEPPLGADGSRRWRLVGVCTDITEHKRAEEALHASEELYRTLLQSLPQRIFFKDVQGAFMSVNEVFAADVGARPEELVGKTDHDLFPKRLADKYRADDRRVMENRESETLEEANVVNGQERIVEVVKAPVAARDGSVMGVLGVFTDITDRKRLEERLREAQKMEAVGRLAGGIAHEFNNLLMAITGYSELMRLKVDAGDPLRRYVDEIAEASDRAAALIRQLLAFSRKQMLAPQVLDLNAILLDLRQRLQIWLGEQIEVVTLLAPDIGHVEADPSQIEQVLMHLAANARDAMPRGGTFTIETANVEVDDGFARRRSGAQPGAFVRLAVRDTGRGMDAETQSHLFEPFFTTKQVGEGTGLGLATVYGIVKQSNGNIWVESAPDQGTRVEIHLPRLPEATVSLRPGDVLEPATGGSETVLVTEDEDMVRNVVCEVLTRSGYQVLAARSGQEALQASELHAAPIHLLVTDVIMPEMSGLDLAQRLATQRPGVRVLYMSGYSDPDLAGAPVQVAITPLLRKPFTPDTLARKVREVLDSS